MTELDENTELDEDGSKYLTFNVSNVCYGLNIETVTEIIGVQSITSVPDVPDSIRGVINLRGKVIPVMDVRARFNLEDLAYHERTCIIVIEVDGGSIGLVVDAVCEVVDIPEGQIEPPPKVGFGEESRAISGLGKVGDDLKLILDARVLVAVEGDLTTTESQDGATAA